MQSARDSGRLKQIDQFEADAVGTVGKMKQLSRVVDVHHRDAAVVLIRADQKNAGHREAFDARQYACGGNGGLWCDDGDFVAGRDAEFFRQLLPQHDAKTSRRQCVEFTEYHFFIDHRHLRFDLRIDTHDLHAGHLAAEIQHPLPFDVGCGAGNLRIAPRDLFQSAPICQAAFGTDDLRMRRHAQDMVTHIADEAVHYRHHRNQHRRAQGHAQHRGQRDKGNEVIAAFCARIAQADEQLDGTKHGRGLYGADCVTTTRGHAILKKSAAWFYDFQYHAV